MERLASRKAARRHIVPREGGAVVRGISSQGGLWHERHLTQGKAATGGISSQGRLWLGIRKKARGAVFGGTSGYDWKHRVPRQAVVRCNWSQGMPWWGASSFQGGL